MKSLLLAAALALGLFSTADARWYSHSYSHHRSAYDERDLMRHDRYTNVSGHSVHSPSRSYSGRMPSGASAHCSDGSWSFSEHHRGTCSHHGGVAEWE